MTLTGKLIDGSDAFRWMLDTLGKIEQPIDICSAFLRSEALGALFQSTSKPLRGRILVRWRLCDFLAGASDFHAYDVAMSYGISLYMRLDFHGKVYSLPPHGVMVGSANATLSGMGLTPAANAEICTLSPYDADSQRVIDELYTGATLVDGALCLLLQSAFQQCEMNAPLEQQWPSSVLATLAKRQERTSLLVDECLWSGTEWLRDLSTELGVNVLHDRTLLGLLPADGIKDISKHMLRHRFKSIVQYQWLIANLEKNNGEVYFGQLSASLHCALADHPVPMRSSVKVLLQNLLDWVSLLASDEIEITRPQYSQRVRILNRKIL